MAMYVFLVFCVLIGGYINSKSDSKNSKLIYCTIIGIIMLIIIGLRNINLGILDTKGIYVPAFKNIIYMDIEQIFRVYNKDVVFYIITKFFTIICQNVNLWLILVSIPLIYAVTKLVYKYSKIPSLSFIIFFSLNYYGMNFTLLRHSIALAFIILSYPYLKERKFWRFLIYVLIGSCFHQTALIFLIAYPIVNMKFNWKQIIALIGMLLFSIIAKDFIFNLIFLVLKGERFQSYADRGVTIDLMPFYINTALLIFSYVFYRLKTKEYMEQIDMLFNLSTISSVFLTLTPIIGEAYRVAMFFGIYNILLLPETLKLENKMEEKFMVYIPVYSVLILYFLFFALDNAMIVPYKFFWQS